MPKMAPWRRWMRGTLASLQETTTGGEQEIVLLMNKLDTGVFKWAAPFRVRVLRPAKNRSPR